MTERSEEGTIAFAERLLALLDDGAFTATYKYAVLVGLMDLCMEGTSARGTPPTSVTTRQLAEKVLDLYWPHTTPYGHTAGARVLRQNAGGQAEILTAIRKFRASLPDDPLAPLARARAAASKDAPGKSSAVGPGGRVSERLHGGPALPTRELQRTKGPTARLERLVQTVERKLIEMPLPRLQTVGNVEQPLLYRIAWDRTVRLGDVRRYQRGERAAFDNRILLLPGVGDHLTRLNGVIRPLLLRHWTALVARFNRLEEARLERFLFGTERTALEPVRTALVEYQRGRCFYCDGRLAGRTEVDHFIPWSRYPDDALDNLVAADRRCNGHKRDFLAAAPHVQRWRRRLDEPSLDELATATGWHRTSAATLGVARAIYLRLPPAVPLWVREDRFDPAEPNSLAQALA